MAELQLVIMSRGPHTERDMRPLLDTFETRHPIAVELRVIEWDNAWPATLSAALQQEGPDVSEIGSSWLGSLLGMNALRPFRHYETLPLGGPAAFIPSVWQGGSPAWLLPQSFGETWAIPWWADTRILFYRRDMLAKAGLGEEGAFDTHEQMVRTLERLERRGVPIPLTLPTHRSRMTLHHVASWIWGAGGDLISPSGTHTRFADPPARTGIRNYFSLARFLAPAHRHLSDVESDALYWQGQAAVTVSGPWLLRQASPEVIENTGVLFPPGVPFVGGSHLVCWGHTRHGAEAVKLVQFLAGQQVQKALGQRAGMLPTRVDTLMQPPFSDKPIYWLVARGLQRGRSFPCVPLWGLVEDKLTGALGDIWASVTDHPGASLDTILTTHLNPLARQLDVTLGGSR
ncbi:MAG: extracellular solute-binding protein [Anaerolineae bacterium]|nr:extracellular solute-binding protein [Anaerolineae bacterium]